jgi:hypothetical protein
MTTPLASAQSTIGDPTPIMGDQARSIAGNAALRSAAGAQGGGSSYTVSRDVREQHRAQMKVCRDNYRASTRSGSAERKAARDACERRFYAQRASWKK